MVKEKFFPEKYLKKTTDKENIIRRVAGVDYVKSRA